MKHQQISVDYWEMVKKMFTYGVLVVLFWIMLRLFQVTFLLPRRLRSQQENIQSTLQELQRKFPDLNITQEELENLEADVEKILKEDEAKDDISKVEESDVPPSEETKKHQ